ncbi:hypothetical protein BKA59DRAFT_281311 [Fusarium tricinctum]|uniref:Uncharacterized protein n=2 Tax=Fusarium tricinctum species complex TaxID=679429 RepID=A0A8K0RQ73_9HYPO|nr:hypothetical protein DER45DRAFT_614990 [Fusarium avenaceum]KAH7235713.1 hypothetical protein BKA59DRAFT_281311 [Fusarium tricinctum]
MPEGRQSPAPEDQSDRQQQAPPASGHGVNKTDGKDPKGQLDNLSSNPKSITEDAVKEKFSKTEK